MDENYFKNIRTVGANLDEGIAKLEEKWKMPQLFLCKKDKPSQETTKLIHNLRNELRNLKETIEENKAAVASLRETQTQFLEETTKAIKYLKDEVNDIKVLFAENGYVEDPMEDELSILNNQLESLIVNDNNQMKDSDHDMTESSICENASVYNSTISEPFNVENPTMNNVPIGVLHKKLLKEPVEPQYSPHYYKLMKKK